MRIMLLILAAGALAHKCSTTNKGVNHSLAQAIAHNLNSLRNRVATGQTSFEGSESASNMNLVHWSNGYAKRAQACAENCPAKSSTCREHEHFGVLVHQRYLSSSKKTQQVIEHWYEDSHKAKQLLLARQEHFGCGVASDGQIEYIVCFFDKKYEPSKQSFLAGPVGAACKFGRSKMYSGLCATGSGSLIEQRKQQQTEQLLLLNSEDFM